MVTLIMAIPGGGGGGGQRVNLQYVQASICTLKYFHIYEHGVGNLSPAMGARNQVGIRFSYRPASLCSLATQFRTRFLESIPRPIAGLKFSIQVDVLQYEHTVDTS
jgi:hypothetical protein